MKTQEVPVELREFYAQFKKPAYRHDYVTVFDDFLSAMMNYFTPPEYPGIDVRCFDKYTKEERLLIGGLIPIVIQTFDKNITGEQSWFDPFGDFYQILSSRGKQSVLGRYFTPPHIVDFMTLLNGEKEELTGKGIKVNDPACGSGRFLIAFHANFPGNYMYGEDLDQICCKMSCLNMMLHGCEGEVVYHNSLDPNHYIRGWRINYGIRTLHLPTIIPLEKENSFVHRMWQNRLVEMEKDASEKRYLEEQEVLRKVGLQMDLF
jgi:type I restriction enzyme M protein